MHSFLFSRISKFRDGDSESYAKLDRGTCDITKVEQCTESFNVSKEMQVHTTESQEGEVLQTFAYKCHQAMAF